MPTYVFKATDLAGVAARGEVDAVSKQDVADQLKQRGLIVVDIANKYRSRELNIELFKRVKPASDLAFTWDRVCKDCGTRYTPPTPRWARVLFAVVGIGILVGSLLTAAWMINDGELKGFITFLVIGLFLGGGCLYRALASD